MLSQNSTTTAPFIRPLIASLIILCLSGSIKAQTPTPPPTKKKTISLIAQDGTKLPIGTLTLTKTNKGHSFKVTMDDSKFAEFFLNMAPFQCIEGALMYCHLPYPYKTRKTITDKDLKDLEYEFLFVQKRAKDYGIDFWNGVYFRLKKTQEGNFTGTVFETDMNELMAPPEQDYARPIGGGDLSEAAQGKHRFPRIEIK